MHQPLASLDLGPTLWERVFLPAPLVVVGTLEPGGGHDLAPKHMVTPLGFAGHLGFVCTPRHATWRNARRTGTFTMSWPRPGQVVQASLAASPRSEDGDKAVLDALPVQPARQVEGVLLADGLMHVECELDRVIEGFGEHGLVVGRVVAAWAPPEALREHDRDETALIGDNPVLVYLHPSRFASVDDSLGFPFPTGFQR